MDITDFLDRYKSGSNKNREDKCYSSEKIKSLLEGVTESSLGEEFDTVIPTMGKEFYKVNCILSKCFFDHIHKGGVRPFDIIDNDLAGRIDSVMGDNSESMEFIKMLIDINKPKVYRLKNKNNGIIIGGRLTREEVERAGWIDHPVVDIIETIIDILGLIPAFGAISDAAGIILALLRIIFTKVKKYRPMYILDLVIGIINLIPIVGHVSGVIDIIKDAIKIPGKFKKFKRIKQIKKGQQMGRRVGRKMAPMAPMAQQQAMAQAQMYAQQYAQQQAYAQPQYAQPQYAPQYAQYYRG